MVSYHSTSNPTFLVLRQIKLQGYVQSPLITCKQGKIKAKGYFLYIDLSFYKTHTLNISGTSFLLNHCDSIYSPIIDIIRIVPTNDKCAKSQ